MVIEVRQAYGFFNCTICERTIPQGSLYLFTHGIGPCYYYCKYCSVGKYSYTLEDFECFRPEADIFIKYDIEKYTTWDNSKVNLGMLT